MATDYSIIVPAYNEERWLPATLQALKQAMATQALRGELIVVDNNSSDNTAALARAAGAKLVFEPYNQISRARNAGAAQARGRFLLFVDADTHLSAALLARALQKMDSGCCCGGGARVAFDHLPSRASRLGLALWNFLSRRLHLAAGCFLYARREAFAAVGGFSEAVYASEEIWLSRRLRHWGRRHGERFCIIDDEAALSSGRKLEWFGPWRQAGLLLLVLVFPFFVRFRRLCGFWYQRPEH
ncbi:MAG TPA: glycosyltransferase [Gammaproteobacteria bacterium]